LRNPTQSNTIFWKYISGELRVTTQSRKLMPGSKPHGSWVQTERAAHEAWGGLIARKPKAAQLLHQLIASMLDQNAVVISQKTLAKLLSCSPRTIQTAVKDLVKERWIQIVKLNGPGTVMAYVVNDQVAWGQPRDQLKLSIFSATVVADHDDQDAISLASKSMHGIPSMMPGEKQLPSGPGTSPPSQPAIDGLEPDLPALHRDPNTGDMFGSE
jgi:DNA-binding transcriptional regulator YhcF (GntR family)